MTEPQQTTTPAEAAPPAPPENPLLRHADFVFPADDIGRKIDAALSRQQGSVTMPGFRRGKVPLSMLRQRYGKGVLQEILQQECSPKFQEWLEEKKERAAAPPHLHLPEMAVEGAYKVHCHYEVLPEVKVPDFSGKTLKKPVFTVDDAAVNEMIEILRAQRGTYVAVEDAASGEDCRLRVDFQSVLLPLPGAEGEDAEEKVVESGNDQPLLLADKNLRPELREKLDGARKGETRTAEMVMADAHPKEEMRGRTVRMTVTVKMVEKLQKAELNEEFFALFGDEANTLDAFRDMVRKHLERESKTRLRNALHARAMDMLAGATEPFPLPQSMLMQECHRMLHQAQAEWKQRGMAETASGLSPQMFAPDAARRVALGLILSAWQDREKPDIQKEQIEERLQEIAEAYEDPAAAAAQLRSNQNEMQAVYLSVLEDRVTDWVCEKCESEEVTMTLNDFFSEGEGGAQQ